MDRVSFSMRLPPPGLGAFCVTPVPFRSTVEDFGSGVSDSVSSSASSTTSDLPLPPSSSSPSAFEEHWKRQWSQLGLVHLLSLYLRRTSKDGRCDRPLPRWSGVGSERHLGLRHELCKALAQVHELRVCARLRHAAIMDEKDAVRRARKLELVGHQHPRPAHGARDLVNRKLMMPICRTR